MLSRLLRRPVKAKEIARIRERLLSQGEIVEVNIEGLKNVHYALAGDANNLREVSAGRVPLAWNPYDTTTREESNVSFTARHVDAA